MKGEKEKSNKRAERLSAALRANLQRRKAQSRQRSAEKPQSTEQPGPAKKEG